MKPADNVNMSDVERLDIAKQLASDIRTSLPTELYADAFTVNSKIPYKATCFREGLIHRVSDIADTALALYDDSKLVPAFVATRAVIETTVMMYWLYEKSAKFEETQDAVAYDEFLMKGMLGSRDCTTPLDSYNILTAIDRVDREFEDYRRMYDALCECTHPNWSGVMGAYSKTDPNNYMVHLGKEHGNPRVGLGLDPLAGSLSIFIHYYNETTEIMEAINNRYG